MGFLLLLLLLLLLLSDSNVGLVLTKEATLGLTFSGTQGLEWYMSVWVIFKALFYFIITQSQHKSHLYDTLNISLLSKSYENPVTNLTRIE